MDSEKKKALDMLATAVNKQYDGSIFHVGVNSKTIRGIDVISTGSLGLDMATCIGGLPRGRIVEVYGGYSTGKSTVSLHTIANCQRAGLIAAYVDAEQALDLKYARALGVNTDDLVLVQSDYGEQALDIVDLLVKSEAVGMVVVDSVAALTPLVELEGTMEDQQMGLQARMMSKALRKITANAFKTNTLVVFTNQIRSKIGGYGNPEVTPGGQALPFYSSVRLQCTRREIDADKGSNLTKVKVVKNKLGIPFNEAEFHMIWGQGIDYFGELVDIGSTNGIIDKGGSWYTINGARIQGRQAARDMIEANPQVADELYAKILATINQN